MNLALCSTEKLDLMDIDRLAELLKVILAAQCSNSQVRLELANGQLLVGKLHQEWETGDNAGLGFMGRLMDLKSAYKQLAVHEDSLWASNVHIPNCDQNGFDYYNSAALLFGATAAVYAFNRFGRAIWRAMTVTLDLVLTQFYDDFPHLEPEATAVHARMIATEFLDLLGISWSGGPKDKEFALVFEPLGVRVDLSDFADKAAFSISNKPSRIESICGQLDDILASYHLSPSLASELHGKLNFAQNQIFGRAGLPAIRQLSQRANEISKSYDLNQGLVTALSFLKDYLGNAKPRIITGCDCTKNILVFSDGAFEQGHATWGFFILDTADDSCWVDGGAVDDNLSAVWLNAVGEQIITQVELYAVLMARTFLDKTAAGRKIIYFIDNDGARDALIRGFSESSASLSIIYQFYRQERDAPSSLWFARVPSHSNVSDAPSRGLVKQTAEEYGAQIVSTSLTTSTMQALLNITTQDS